jgi:hypothetical protein
MKRSEAILNIINVLRLTGNHYCDDGRDEQDAERILKRLEAIGMLPPETKATPSDLSNTGFTQEFLDEHNFSVSKWESEDEE